MDRPASLNDIEAFEEVLRVGMMVVSARLGNKFITSLSTDERLCIYVYMWARLGNKFITSLSTDKRPCIYVYLVDDDHYHAITSITGFFSNAYFCKSCLKHYSNRDRHACDTKCIVCKTENCPKTDSPVKCQDCNMDCRSEKCYQKHKQLPVHKKGKFKGKPNGLSQCKK